MAWGRPPGRGAWSLDRQAPRSWRHITDGGMHLARTSLDATISSVSRQPALARMT